MGFLRLGQQLLVSNVRKEFSEPQMKRKAIAAAEQYYRRNLNPLPAQPGASSRGKASIDSEFPFHASMSF